MTLGWCCRKCDFAEMSGHPRPHDGGHSVTLPAGVYTRNELNAALGAYTSCRHVVEIDMTVHGDPSRVLWCRDCGNMRKENDGTP